MLAGEDIGFLVGGSKEGSIRGRHCSSHCCTLGLVPEGVAELEDIIPHDDGESLGDKVGGVMSTLTLEEGFHCLDTLPDGDVGVHRDGVKGKEFDGRWKCWEGGQKFQEVICIAKIGLRGLESWLEFLV